jgi:ribosomal protein L3 glutamine methyltransferase
MQKASDNSVLSYVEAAKNSLESAEVFYGHGTDNALDEAVYLVFASLGLDYADPHSGQRQLSVEERTLLDARLEQRISRRIPVAYLVGEAWFAGRRFLADARALVPRSPIAELLLEGEMPFLQEDPERILDLCCGGGCIGITAALEYPEAQVDLADLSGEALELAQENVDLHGLSDRVTLLQGDLFGLIRATYEIILCNPPYVAAEEMLDVPQEYRHEPEMGLVSNDEGLELPLRILREAADYLKPQGVLILEVGFSHPQLSARLADVPLVWLEFAHGGEGVLAIVREDLLTYREHFI